MHPASINRAEQYCILWQNHREKLHIFGFWPAFGALWLRLRSRGTAEVPDEMNSRACALNDDCTEGYAKSLLNESGGV
jgi:hypothetical protein